MNEESTSLADALAERALRRAASAATIGGFALGALALVLLVLAGGRVDAGSLPQTFILGAGQVAGVVIGVRCQLATRRVLIGTGTGPQRAQEAAGLLRATIRVLLLVTVAVAVWSLVTLRPLPTAALSVAIGTALLVQFVLLLHLQGRALLRAGPRP